MAEYNPHDFKATTRGNLVYEPDVDKRAAFRLPTDLEDTIRIALTFGDSKTGVPISWSTWASIARDLGQECAKRCWVYPGPADQDEPPEGGTPVAMRMAA